MLLPIVVTPSPHFGIGFASFDESSGTDSIGVAHFVFGYKSTHAEIYDYSAWVTLGAAITLALLLEHVVLRRVRRVSLVQVLCGAWP